MRLLLRWRGVPAAATLTLLSVLSVALCSPVILLLLAEAATQRTQQLVLLGLAGAVPLVVAPISLLPLQHALGKLEDARSQLRQVASIDSLTGALTRSIFFERAAIEWARAARHGTPLSAVMLDRFAEQLSGVGRPGHVRRQGVGAKPDRGMRVDGAEPWLMRR